MKWTLSSTVVAVGVCCLFSLGFCQDPTDIYRGCYFDGVDRALHDLITCGDGMGVCQKSCGIEETYCEGQTGMTVDFCRTLCRNRNLQYYALEAGKQCFCGGALSDPFQNGKFEVNPFNCSYPCSGNSNQTCGGDYKMEVYEFVEPVENSSCFHPGFVPNAYVSEDLAPGVGEKVTFLCEPGHTIIGEPQLTCQEGLQWSPNVLPICNYTGIFPDPTTQPVSTPPKTTTPQGNTTVDPIPTTLPQLTITDFLPYIIGGSAALVFLLVICMVAICTCKGRKRSGNARQDIRLKPESAPVTFINAGFSVENEEFGKSGMPDILSASGNLPQSKSADNSYAEKHYPQNTRMSTFADDGIYQNGEEIYQNSDVTDSKGTPQAIYANMDQKTAPTDNPPSPVYANAEVDLPSNNPESDQPKYTRQYSGYATTDRANIKRGSSSDDPTFVYATDNRRAKKNATGTKDLTGWSRPSSLYQRTTLDDSDEDNTVANPENITNAIYAQIDKSRKSDSRETLNTTTSDEGNSFFADPTKTSATRL